MILLSDVFEKFIKVSIEEFDLNPLYCVSLPGSTYQFGLKYSKIRLQTLQDIHMIVLIEKIFRNGYAVLWVIVI